VGKTGSKNKPKSFKKSARAERSGQLIREPMALRLLAPEDRQAIEDYYRFHPLAKRGR
jgi:hypothetical protein